MEIEETELDRRQQSVRSAKDLADFLQFLEEKIVLQSPEARKRNLSDALSGVAGWLSDTDVPDKPDWAYVANLMVAAVYYN